jgi:hypothetical protein
MKTGRKYGRRTKERRSVFVFLTGGRRGLCIYRRGQVKGRVIRKGDRYRRNGQVWQSHR